MMRTSPKLAWAGINFNPLGERAEMIAAVEVSIDAGLIAGDFMSANAVLTL